jgi:predicted small secreted protein
MSARLLVSAAVLATGVAVASAQNTQSGVGQDHLSQGAAAQEAGRPKGVQSGGGVPADARAERKGGALHIGRAEIREVQTALNRGGFNVGEPNGVLGPRTKKALAAFQKQHGFEATGKIDRATLDALRVGGTAQEGTQGRGGQTGGAREGGDQPSPTTGQGTSTQQPSSEERPRARRHHRGALGVSPPSTTGQGGLQSHAPAGSSQEPGGRDIPANDNPQR